MSPVVYFMDLQPRYRQLYQVFYTSQLKAHIGLIPDIKPPVVINNDNSENKYKV